MPATEDRNAAGFHIDTEVPRPAPIRITGVNIHRLSARLEKRFGWSLGFTDTRTASLVEVTTDVGLTGWGDGFFGDLALLRNPELVIGRSPFDAEAIFDDLRAPAEAQRRVGAQSCGGLDTALWDIMGQALGVPVWRLLGRQYRSRIQPYCTALYRQDWPDLASGLAREASNWKACGYRAMKMKVGYGPRQDVENVQAVRAAVGEDIILAVDANCAYDAATALALGARLERYDIAWFEEPVPADDFPGYERLRAGLRMPLAGGETFCLDDLVARYVQTRLVDILQPEIQIVGLTGGRRLSYLCWLNRIRLMPHNWSTALRTAGILHWMSTVPPVTGGVYTLPVMFELDQTENPLRDVVLKESPRIGEDGCIPVPDGPGLGVSIVREAVEHYREELVRIR